MRFRKIIKWLLGIQEKPKINHDIPLPNIICIIPAYNEEATIAKTIESLQAQTVPISRIIVVDDCSQDKTADIAKECGAEVIRTPKNTGTKARAQNYALQFIEDEDAIVVTVDADTCLKPDAIEKTLPYLLTDKNVASVCGFVIPQKIETFWEKARFIQYLYHIWLNKGAQNHMGVPLVSSGCFSVFNFRLLKEFGGFPDKTMAEDMDLTWRFLMGGKKIKLVPQAVCYPLDPPTWKLYRAQVERWYRSFLQNISLHRHKLFKNKRLAFFVFWYLISGLMAPIYWILLPLIVIKLSLITNTVGIFAGIMLLYEFFMVTTISLINAWRFGQFKKAVKSLPCYWVSMPVESYLFVKSIILEWFLKRRLVRWEKGH